MKTKKFIVPLLAAGLLMNLPLVYATGAPVEDLSIDGPQPAQGAPVDNSSSSPAYNDQQKVQRQDNVPQTAMAQIPADPTPAPNNTANASTPTSNLTSAERLDRLEQQMANITNMNLPQQIEAMRQEIQQLNGRLQVQQHDIKVLENQQRSFYQDLNRRIQQIGSGNMSLTQKRKLQTTAKTMAANPDMQDSAAYRSAFNLLVKKQYDDALVAFQDYINRYPRGAFVANAYYWMGELYLKKDDTKMATESFGRVTSQYPSSNKVPDAKLKLAIIHISQGKVAEGKAALQTIKRQYPNSTAAQLATIQLQRMAQ